MLYTCEKQFCSVFGGFFSCAVDKKSLFYRRFFMENNCNDFFEIGDCMAVFAGKYLGCGKMDFSLKSAWHELRRDDFMPLRSRNLQAIDAAVVLELKNGDRVLPVLENADRSLFTDGGVLRLLPIDRRRSGFEFPRAFFDRMEHVSGDGISGGAVKVAFACESFGNGGFFTHLSGDVYPDDLPEMTFPDLKDLLRTLGILLAEKLDVVFDHTLCINHIAPNPRGGYSLELLSCRDWSTGAWGTFELKLNASIPVEEKFASDQKLYDAAQFMHGYVFECNNVNLHCRIKELDFSSTQSVVGKNFARSSMRFTLALS